MSIGVSSNAFPNFGDILSVVFKEHCEYVGENAFVNCSNLKKINDNNEIKEIHSSAFANCINLTNISFPNLNTISGNAFANCINLQEINIPNVSSIGSSAFASCSILKSVNLSSESITVNGHAFESCNSLQNIYLDNCTTIENYAFKSCSSLSNINFKNCETIGEYAFESCIGLNTISFYSMTSIGNSAFINCSNLSNIYINGTDKNSLCSLSNHAFCSCSSDLSQCLNTNITFYIKPETIESYKLDSFWKHYSNNFITQPEYYQIIYTSEDGTELGLHKNFIDKYDVTSDKINNSIRLSLEKRQTDSNSDKKLVFDLDCEIFGDDRNKLTSIIIPPNCEIIGENVFNGCEKLETITLSNSLKHINNSAFQNCSKLTNINLPNNLESIGTQSFYGCESLTSFKLPESLETIGDGVFGRCKNIEKFYGKFVTYDGNAVVYNNSLIAVAPKSNIKYYKISDIDENISQLNAMCFSCCDNIRRVDIDLNLNILKQDIVFDNCENLYEVHVKGNVGNIESNNDFISYDDSQHSKVKVIIKYDNFVKYYYRFNETFIQALPKPNNNQIIYFTENNQNIKNTLRSRDNTIGSINSYNLSNLTYHCINKNTNYLASSLFKGLPVSDVLIGDNFTTLYNDVFMNCEYLTYIDMPNIQYIQNNCFNNCKKLTKISMPPNLNLGEYVFQNTFYGCEILKEFISYKNEYVSDDNMCYIKNNNLLFFAQGGLSEEDGKYTIPDNVNIIWHTTFKNCIKLKEITIHNNVTDIHSSAFENCSELTKVSITNYSRLNTISSNSFKGCTSLESITLPNILTSLGVSAFEGCTKLKKVSIATNSNLNNIGNNSFKNCTSLESMILPNNLTSIGDSAFEGCNKYRGSSSVDGGITIKNLTSIGNKCFYGTNIPKISIDSKKLTSIGESAFEGCTNLSKVLIVTTAPIQTINKKAFYGCSNIENTVTIPTTVTTIGDSAFEGCAKLTFNDTNIQYVTNIGISAFKGCESLTKIRINNSISTINESVFEGCTNLKTINISLTDSNLNTISNNSFKNCTSLTTMILPNNLTSIGVSAFEGCSQFIGNFSDGLRIKENITSIGNRCFYGTNIPKLTINSTKLTTIPTSAFEACAELTTVSIATNSKLTTIGTNAFSTCRQLSKFNSANSGELILPNTIQHIEDYAFYACDIAKINLKNNASLLDLGNYCFNVITNNGTRYPEVYVPEMLLPGNSISEFKKNGVRDSGSNPITYGGTKIYVKSNLLNKYKGDLFWTKYKNYMIGY